MIFTYRHNGADGGTRAGSSSRNVVRLRSICTAQSLTYWAPLGKGLLIQSSQLAGATSCSSIFVVCFASLSYCNSVQHRASGRAYVSKSSVQQSALAAQNMDHISDFAAASVVHHLTSL
jgi:hypothetical protein